MIETSSFISKLEIESTRLHVCSTEVVVDPLFDSSKNIPDHTQDLYFCQGVKMEQVNRSSDRDIVMRNHISVDIDYMKIFKGEKKGEKTKIDDAMKQEIKEYSEIVHEKLNARGYSPNAIVFSGGGFHVYWFGDVVDVNKDRWASGMRFFHKMIETAIDTEVDPACVNAGRIMKLPGSFVHSRGQRAEVWYLDNNKSPFVGMLQDYGNQAPMTIYLKEKEMKDGMSFETAVKMLDNKKCLEVLSGSKAVNYQKFVFRPNSSGGHAMYIDNKSIGCWVDKDGNIGSNMGSQYAPYLDRWLTYYGHTPEQAKEIIVSSLKDMLPKSALPVDSIVSPIDEVFRTMGTLKIDYLKTGDEYLDFQRLFAKGMVTRIGAWSNIGKSKLAYWIACKFIEHDKVGLFFSTEVIKQYVLANMLSYFDKEQFSKIMGTPYTNETMMNIFRRTINILDQSDGSDQLANIRTIVSKSKGIDFIVVDFCQDIMDYEKSRDEYVRMSNYAMQIQVMAQQYNICIIDLSQLSNEGGKDRDMGNSGFIPFRGSGYLYHKADVAIWLKRDKTSDNNLMTIGVKKNKFWMVNDVDCDINLALNEFEGFRKHDEIKKTASKLDSITF